MAANSSGLWTVSCGQEYFLAANLALFACVLMVVLAVAVEGFRRWRRRRSGSVAMATSHTDVFTYHMTALELVSGLIILLLLCARLTQRPAMMAAAISLTLAIFPGQTLFHLLTCVERYLAVAHPVAFLGLKGRGAARIRNLSVGGVWLLCGAWAGLSSALAVAVPLMFGLNVVALLVVAFCCLAVLRALIGPKPGARGGRGGSCDRSRRRALPTMMATAGALLLKFLVNGLSFASILTAPNGRLACLVTMATISLHLPSSLVLPLLYLQRAGKLAVCRRRRPPAATNQTS